MALPRSYWLHREVTGLNQEVTGLNQEVTGLSSWVNVVSNDREINYVLQDFHFIYIQSMGRTKIILGKGWGGGHILRMMSYEQAPAQFK